MKGHTSLSISTIVHNILYLYFDLNTATAAHYVYIRPYPFPKERSVIKHKNCQKNGLGPSALYNSCANPQFYYIIILHLPHSLTQTTCGSTSLGFGSRFLLFFFLRRDLADFARFTFGTYLCVRSSQTPFDLGQQRQALPLALSFIKLVARFLK